MSTHSTITITRAAARAAIIKAALKATDDELEDLMRVVLEERLLNARVVGDAVEGNDDHLL